MAFKTTSPFSRQKQTSGARIAGWVAILFVGLSVGAVRGDANADGAAAYKKAADRAQCILSIRTIQQAVRTYQNTNQLKPGDPLDWKKIFGPDAYIAKEPTCPAGGKYTFSDVFPAFGDTAAKCSHAADLQHQPKDATGW